MREPQTVMREMLERNGGDIMVQIVPAKGVTGLPPELATSDQVALRIMLNEPNPVIGLTIDHVGWRAILSFNGVPTELDVPWRAVTVFNEPGYAVVLRHEDLAQEFVNMPQEDRPREADTTKPTLKVVK